MATTNMQQWNSTAVNQETDAEYTADSSRAGGATTGSIFLSPLGNKVFYQFSTYLTALFTAFANKGFTTSDSNLNTLTAQCANFLTTADTLPQIVSVAYTPTPTFNAAASTGFQMTLTGNITGMTISGAAPGELIAFYFFQDSAGGRTITWPSNVVAVMPQPDPSINICTMYLFRVDLAGSLLPAAPAISYNGTYVTNLTARNTVTAAGLQVNGNATITGNTTVSGSETVTGTLATNGLQVNGAATVTGNMTAGGVIATNTQTNNNAAVTGTTTTGSLQVNNNAIVNGVTTLTTLNVNGNESVTGTATAGTLVVTGSATVDNTLTVDGTANVGRLEVASAAPNGQVLTGNGTSYVPATIPRAQGSLNVVTGSRTSGVTYQNTSGGIMLISGAFFTDGGGGLVGNIGVSVGPSSASNVVFANQATATVDTGDAGFYAAVPNGYFYQVNISLGVTGPVHYWVETIIS